MSETLCTLRTKGGGGGRYKETSLWTNSAPTSSFASQTVTLSDSIDKYKYIMFKYSPSTSTVSSVIQKAIYSVEDVKKSTSSSNTPYVTNGSQTSYQTVRTILYGTSTTLSIGSAYKVAQSGSDNTTCIPLEILGLNELAHGHRMNETVLWSNSDPTQTMSGGTTANLSDSLDNYDYVGVKYRFSTTSSSEGYTLMPVTYFKRCLNPSSGDIMFTISTQNTSNNFFARRIIYGGSTAIGIASCLNANSAQTENNRCIPTAIIGCKLS